MSNAWLIIRARVLAGQIRKFGTTDAQVADRLKLAADLMRELSDKLEASDAALRALVSRPGETAEAALEAFGDADSGQGQKAADGPENPVSDGAKLSAALALIQRFYEFAINAPCFVYPPGSIVEIERILLSVDEPK